MYDMDIILKYLTHAKGEFKFFTEIDGREANEDSSIREFID